MEQPVDRRRGWRTAGWPAMGGIGGSSPAGFWQPRPPRAINITTVACMAFPPADGWDEERGRAVPSQDIGRPPGVQARGRGRRLSISRAYTTIDRGEVESGPSGRADRDGESGTRRPASHRRPAASFGAGFSPAAWGKVPLSRYHILSGPRTSEIWPGIEAIGPACRWPRTEILRVNLTSTCDLPRALVPAVVLDLEDQRGQRPGLAPLDRPELLVPVGLEPLERPVGGRGPPGPGEEQPHPPVVGQVVREGAVVVASRPARESSGRAAPA